MVRNVCDDRVPTGEEPELEPEGGLVVKQVLPPVAWDEFGEHDQDGSGRIVPLSKSKRNALSGRLMISPSAVRRVATM